MIIVSQGAGLQVGPIYVTRRTEAVGITADAFVEGDQVKDSTDNYWDILSVQEYMQLDSFVCRGCNLSKSFMYQDDFGSTTWSKTRASDVRYRMKVWLDQSSPDDIIRASQITKDDDSTTADFAVIFNNPPYQIWREFRGDSNMEGLFVVDQPNSTALIGALTKQPYGYEEHVPVHIVTVNSTGCSGSALASKMEAELRYACENYAIGTDRVRNVERRGKRDIRVGGMALYDTEFVVSYRRGKDV